MSRIKKVISLGILLGAPLAHSKIAFIEDNTPAYELPRSKTKTYLQTGSIEQNLKPIKAAKPGALSDEELAAIPERYLPPDLKAKQREIKARIQARKKAEQDKSKYASKTGAPLPAVPKIGQQQPGSIGKDSGTVRVRSRANKLVDIKINKAIWVPPTAAVDSAILAPEQKLPEVQLLQEISVTTSGEVKKEIIPGDMREMHELFQNGKTVEASKKPLLKAYEFYKMRDFATSATLALEVLSEKTSSASTKRAARFLLAHSLFRAGFYASAVPHLIELVSTEWRRSAVGIIAQCLEKTRDDSAAGIVLSKISVSQIPEAYQALFSFHLGRLMLNTGARQAALAAFEQVPPDSLRYPEAQYYLGVVKTAEITGSPSEGDWEKEGTLVNQARSHFETALLSAPKEKDEDLKNLIRVSMARLAYQARQHNQAIYFYSEVDSTSSFAREAAYESAWALYRIGEYNRSLGMLHALNSPYFESRDLAEIWILRSLSYLKLCRFDEARQSAGEFERLMKELVPELSRALGDVKKLKFAKPSNLKEAALNPWIRDLLLNDAVVKKDFASESLFELESQRLAILAKNERVADVELRESAAQALQNQLQKKIRAVAGALKPFIENRISDITSEYRGQKERLDFLKFEIYSQATRYPKALERPEANKMLAQKEFLPGVFSKGHEILWRFSGEYWLDELKAYDYFIPTECKADLI